MFWSNTANLTLHYCLVICGMVHCRYYITINSLTCLILYLIGLEFDVAFLRCFFLVLMYTAMMLVMIMAVSSNVTAAVAELAAIPAMLDLFPLSEFTDVLTAIG